MKTTTEAAASLGLTQGRIRQLCIAGVLKGTKAGRDWLIEEKSLRAYKPRSSAKAAG